MPKAVEKNVFIGRNPDTGRPYFRKKIVIIPSSGEIPPSPENFSDADTEFVFQKPSTMGGVTPEQIERSREQGLKRRGTPGVEASQPRGDKD